MHRLSQGVKGEDIGMPNCHRIEYYWLKGKLMHECKHCHKRIGLRVGTVMHGSEMLSQTWMYTVTMQLLSSRLPSAKSVIVDLRQAYKKTVVLDVVKGVPNVTTHLPCKSVSDRLSWAVISF